MRKQQVRTRAEDRGFHTAGEGSEWPLRVPIVSLTPAQAAALTARSEVGEPCRGSAGTASLQNPTSGVTTTQQAGGTPEEAAKQKPRPLLPGAPLEAPSHPGPALIFNSEDKAGQRKRSGGPAGTASQEGQACSRCRSPRPGPGTEQRRRLPWLSQRPISAARLRGRGRSSMARAFGARRDQASPSSLTRTRQRSTAHSQPGRTGVTQAPVAAASWNHGSQTSASRGKVQAWARQPWEGA